MRKTGLLSLSVLVLLFVTPLSQAAPVTLTAVLNGANERPGLGDADGAGFAVVRLDAAAGTVSYSLLADGIAPPTMAHIHRGLPDVAGPVVVNFAPVFANGSATGTVNATPALISEIVGNPGAFYVNVHTADFPAGAIRGQLGGTVSGGVGFTAALSGANEIPGPGDADGTGSSVVRIDPSTNTVHWAILVENIGAPVAAHIHRGGADVAGPVIVNFAPVFSNGAAAGSVTAVASSIIDEILANPAGYYVNVHTGDFPGGAVRGQLVTTASGGNDSVLPVAGRVAGANNTFYRTDLTMVNVSGANTQVVLEWYASGSGALTSPTSRATFMLDAGEQLTLEGNELQTALGIGDGIGAIRIVSARPITAGARVYNDRRPENEGTLSQFVPALGSAFNRSSGAIPGLSNQTGATSYRTNIGWFNATNATSTVTFRAHGADGTVLQTVTREIPAGSQQQLPLGLLFPSVAPSDSLYVTFTTAGTPIYVYASVVDNDNGDGIFIAAQPR